jgi:hypothetical protein
MVRDGYGTVWYDQRMNNLETEVVNARIRRWPRSPWARPSGAGLGAFSTPTASVLGLISLSAFPQTGFIRFTVYKYLFSDQQTSMHV